MLNSYPLPRTYGLREPFSTFGQEQIKYTKFALIRAGFSPRENHTAHFPAEIRGLRLSKSRPLPRRRCPSSRQNAPFCGAPSCPAPWTETINVTHTALYPEPHSPEWLRKLRTYCLYPFSVDYTLVYICVHWSKPQPRSRFLSRLLFGSDVFLRHARGFVPSLLPDLEFRKPIIKRRGSEPARSEWAP